MEVLIAGAGIAGLTTACHLAQAGHRVRVFERTWHLSEVGAGIQISANAGHSLAAIGLGEPLRDIASVPPVWNMRLHKTGEVVAAIELGARHAKRHGHPYLLVHRHPLQTLLATRLKDLQPEALHLGRDASRFEENADGVILHFANGDAAQGDLLVIADGIRSTLRGQIADGRRPNYTGYAAWRTLFPASEVSKDLSNGEIDLYMGPRSHCVMYRVPDGVGAPLLNFVSVVERPAPEQESWTMRRPWEEFRDDMAGWHDDIQQVVSAANREGVHLWSLFDRDPLKVWRSDRAILIGDAAHPTMPNIAQGAAMAIEDAAVLARCLEATERTEALEMFQTLRLPRTTRVVEAARKILNAFHSGDEADIRAELVSGQSALSARDTWLYNYNPVTVPLSGAPQTTE